VKNYKINNNKARKLIYNKMAGNAEYIPLDNLNSHENSHKIRVGPSRWKTPEFYFYYLVFIVNIPLMFRCAIKFSSRKYYIFSEIENNIYIYNIIIIFSYIIYIIYNI